MDNKPTPLETILEAFEVIQGLSQSELDLLLHKNAMNGYPDRVLTLISRMLAATI